MTSRTTLLPSLTIACALIVLAVPSTGRADTSVAGVLLIEGGGAPEAWCNDVSILDGNQTRVVAGNLTIGCPSASGATCTGSGDCLSGICTDGVCCSSPCNDGCGSCNQPGFAGTCRPLAQGTVCHPSTGSCDVAETCSGSSPSCPADVLVGAGITCRGPAGLCDVTEVCSGQSGVCAVDLFASLGTICRLANGLCDVAEVCPGGAPACPADGFSAPGAVCRNATGACDPQDVCTGGPSCPQTDPSGLSCDDGNACTLDTCTAGGQCVGATPSCPTGTTFVCGDTPYCSRSGTPGESNLTCGP